MTAVKSYSLEVDIIQLVAAIAKKRNMRQSAVIKEAVLNYADDESNAIDDETSDSYSAALEQIRRGEYFTLEQIEAQINARKAAV